MQYHFLNGSKLHRARATVKKANGDPTDDAQVAVEYEKLLGNFTISEDPKPEPKAKKPRVKAKAKKK